MLLPRRSLRLQQQQQQNFLSLLPPSKNGPGKQLKRRNIKEPEPCRLKTKSRQRQSGGPGRTYKQKLTAVEHRKPNRKRTRDTDPAFDSTGEAPQPSTKRRKNSDLALDAADGVIEASGDPVWYWAESGYWPAWYANMSTNDASRNLNKRVRPSTPSGYTASVQSGDVPPAHSADAEKLLFEHGINLNFSAAREHLSEASSILCTEMLSRVHDDYIPQVSYPISKLSDMLAILSSRSESRIVRDLSPLLVPSAENLFLSGYPNLKRMREEIGISWTKVSTLGGPIPKPDLTVGLDHSVFTEEELQKLQNHKSPNRATLFTKNVLFPFFICEVKCSDQPISRAGRQCGHSGGIATKAIFELYRTISEEAAKDLNGEILLFSIAHDHESVDIFAHFTFLHTLGSQPVIYRYRVCKVLLDEEPIGATKKVRDFVIEVYLTFYDKHLERIQDALKRMNKPMLQQDEEDQDRQAMPPPSNSVAEAMIQQLKEQVAKLEEQQTRRAEEEQKRQAEEHRRYKEEQKRQADQHAESLQNLYKLLEKREEQSRQDQEKLLEQSRQDQEKLLKLLEQKL